jgi:hypothetical protein
MIVMLNCSGLSSVFLALERVMLQCTCPRYWVASLRTRDLTSQFLRLGACDLAGGSIQQCAQITYPKVSAQVDLRTTNVPPCNDGDPETPGYNTPIAKVMLKCISELPSHFHKFGLLVALASAWSLTWFQSPGSRVRVLVLEFYCKIVVAPLRVHVLTFSSPVCVHVLIFSSLVCVHVLTFSFPVTREWECWNIYVNCLALSISSDSWLRWLVHEA